MLNKEKIRIILIILSILIIGFLIRIDSINNTGIPSGKESFYQDPSGLQYMYDMDSYYNYRLTQNYLDHGYLGDIKINGTNWDVHSYFPTGRSAEYPPLIVYLTALIYRLVNLFTAVPLLTVCFWIPAFIGPLVGIPSYFLVKKVTNDYGGFGAGVLAVTAPLYLLRTVPGWFDTDIFNLLFPLLTAYFLIEAVNSRNNLKRGTLFAALAAFSIFLFSIAWQGWIYLFYMIILSAITYAALSKLQNLKIGHFHRFFSIFLFLFIILWYINGNFETLFFPYQFIISNNPNLWPNIFLSVSELKTPSIEQIISWTGIAFLTGIFSFIWIFRILINENLKKHFLGNMDWFYFILIIIWSLFGFFSLIKGVRFILLIIPPLIISSGIMIGIFTQYIDALKTSKRFKIFNKRKYLTSFLSVCFLLAILSPAVIDAHETPSILIPGANDELWNASKWIYNNTPDDTVIISNWAKGHFFTAIANRPVTVDGGSQNTPRTYWIYKAFSTDNENLSAGIFRMLATSGDMTYLTLDNYTNNTIKTVEILNNILGVDKQTAEKTLKNNYKFDDIQTEKILKYSHPFNSNPFVVVTSDEMIDAGKWIFKFGMWKFDNSNNESYNYSSGNFKINKTHLYSNDGVIMDLKTREISWKNIKPYSTTFISNGEIKRYLGDKNSQICIILLIDKKRSIVMDKHFENSLFTKLVLKKENDDNFKSVYKENTVTVWKLNSYSS